jgi:hypothetical protein
MLIEFGEDDEEEWIDFDDFTDIAMRTPYDDRDVLNNPVPEWAPKDGRRSQLLQYMKEFFSIL